MNWKGTPIKMTFKALQEIQDLTLRNHYITRLGHYLEQSVPNDVTTCSCQRSRTPDTLPHEVPFEQRLAVENHNRLTRRLRKPTPKKPRPIQLFNHLTSFLHELEELDPLLSIPAKIILTSATIFFLLVVFVVTRIILP